MSPVPLRSASLAAALAACGVSADAVAAEPVRRYALLVGHNEGGEGRATLRYAHRDAEQLHQVLTGLGGVDVRRASLLLDPTVDELDVAFDELARAVADAGTQRTEVLFYYSGHSDEEGLLLGPTRLAWSELREHMDGIDAKVRLAILDSCASGALIRTKGGERVAPFLVDEASDVGGLAYITSSSHDEVAQEADRLGASYFTHYLTTGLRGAADMSGDGRVTLHEAYRFAKDETLQRTERTQFGPQHANYDFQLSGTGDLVLTDLTFTTASLVLEEGMEGRAMVRTEGGDLVAELNKPLARSVELGLGAGAYEVTLAGDDGRYAMAEVELYAGESTVVPVSAFEWFDGESTTPRGTAPRATVDAEPLGRLPFRWEVVPGMPEPTPDAVDTMVVGVVAAGSSQVDGLTLATAVAHVDGRLEGIGAAMGAVTAGEVYHGAQASLGANLVSGDVRGVQLTNGLNLAEGAVFGMQSALGANVVGEGGEAAQLAVGVNVAGGHLRGLQAAAVNVSEEFGGLQLGVVNVGRQVNGGQIGVINVAGEVDGMQLGVVNVADDVRGAPVGLLSFERDGRHDLLAYASATDWINAEVRLGGDHLYTVLGGGGSPGEQFFAAAGVGVHAEFGPRVWLDLDGVWASYLPSDAFTAQVPSPRYVVRPRATFGVQVMQELAPFVGIQANVLLPDDRPRPLAVAPGWIDSAGEARVWPGVFAGVQF